MKSTRNIVFLLLMMATTFSAQLTQAETYDIDTSHSSVNFKIKHLAISNVKGSFTVFDGHFEYIPGQPDQWSVEAVIQINSVNTGDDDRDEHLQNEDFFHVEKFPTMTFKATGAVMDDDDDDEEFEMKGTLEMHGVTLPVTLEVEFNGAITDPWGSERTGFSASTKINRKDWGLSYGKVLESGGLMIGNEVKISLEIEGVKRK